MLYKLISHLTGVAENAITDTVLDSLGSTPKSSQDFRGISKNESKDVVVSVGGKKWVATYLSQNNNNEPIVTLWLASSETKDIMNNFSSTSNNKYPSSMYGTSWMRASVLNNGGYYVAEAGATDLTHIDKSADSDWAIFTMDGIGGSLTANIEVPENMSWQHTQSVKTYCGWANDLNNEGLDHGRVYQTGQDFSNKEGYTNWSQDRLWLPSMAETSHYSSYNGLWKTNSYQRATISPYYWTRSSGWNSASTVCSSCMTVNNDSYSEVTTDSERIVRPAFHLKLKEAIKNSVPSELEEPSDVSNPYNGEPQELSNITDTTKTKWFDSTFINLTYPSNMTDVGTHKIKAEIKSEYATDGLMFKGTPNTSDTTYTESDTIRWFDFEITPKQIGLVWTKDAKGIWSVTANSDDICTKDQPNASTIVATRYKNKNGTAAYDKLDPPKIIGDYTANAEFKDGNYSAKPGEKTSQDFNLPVLKVPVLKAENFDPSNSQ
ncbi:MAG: hypothetical protein K2I23_00080, partial [Clostridia bacterium]|nr:hypothetical protein [Clostridia bacterium]